MSESGSKENTGAVETIRSTLEKRESQVPWLPASHPLLGTRAVGTIKFPPRQIRQTHRVVNKCRSL